VHDGQQVFVPFTLPGETVLAEIDGDRARVMEILERRAGSRRAALQPLW
jgi:tRNA/tmRNA/rRNA uracil-C5-methylase (TrmA/RlmC/RlmD family)